MKCPKCGNELPQDVTFCAACGTHVDDVQNAEVSQPAPSACGAQDPTSTATACGAQDPAASDTYSPYTQVQEPVYAQGCVSAAWSDIKSTPGWFKRTCLLGLVNLVPILNWFVTGYALRWARQLPLGRIGGMPTTIFRDRNFINGFFFFVISLIVGVVTAVVGWLFDSTNAVGGIVVALVSIALGMFQYVMAMRSAVADSLGAAFDLGNVWDAFKRKPWSVLFITVVPSLCTGICVGLVCVILLLIGLAVIGSDVMSIINMIQYYDYYSTYSATASTQLITSLVNIFVSLLPLLLVCWVVSAVVDAFTQVLVMRAMGHWTARNAANWLNDSKVTATAFIHPIE
jgi:hypothetical protein